MATNRLLPALLAATLGVTACATPYTDAIKTDQQDCQNGNQTACNSLPALLNADAAFRQERSDRVATGLAVLGAGLALGAAAYSAAHPAPTYVYAPPVNCTSMSTGYMVSTSCY